MHEQTRFLHEVALFFSLHSRAVIRDNDGDFQAKCVQAYEDYQGDNIKVFADENNDRYTFEVCMYQDNKKLCEELFAKDRRSKNVQEYMLDNKTDAAYVLLTSNKNINVPEYISKAIEWVKA